MGLAKVPVLGPDDTCNGIPVGLKEFFCDRNKFVRNLRMERSAVPQDAEEACELYWRCTNAHDPFRITGRQARCVQG
jgi:hypothetical protein